MMMPIVMDDKSISGATFSPDRTHRYILWRRWNREKPMAAFIGLNPSRANEIKLDPTITRIVNSAKSHGFGGIYMFNLFSQVTPYPSELDFAQDQITMADRYFDTLRSMLNENKDMIVVLCWGAFKQAKERGQKIMQMFPDAYVFGMTKNGDPMHPLYLRSDNPFYQLTSFTKLQPQ